MIRIEKEPQKEAWVMPLSNEMQVHRGWNCRALLGFRLRIHQGDTKERNTLYVCQSVWIPVSASLHVNFAPVGFRCYREESWLCLPGGVTAPPPLSSCAHVILGACLWEPDNKIWAPLGWSLQKLSSAATSEMLPTAATLWRIATQAPQESETRRIHPIAVSSTVSRHLLLLFAWCRSKSEEIQEGKKRRKIMATALEPVL